MVKYRDGPREELQMFDAQLDQATPKRGMSERRAVEVLKNITEMPRLYAGQVAATPRFFHGPYSATSIFPWNQGGLLYDKARASMNELASHNAGIAEFRQGAAARSPRGCS